MQSASNPSGIRRFLRFRRIATSYPTEHSCRLYPPAGYASFRRQNSVGDVDGRRLDGIVGVKKSDGKIEMQSFRYPLSEDWTIAQARAHCNEHDGILFEPAVKGAELMHDMAQIETQAREEELEALAAYKAGTAEAPMLYRPFGYAVEKASADSGEMTFVANEETEDRTGDIIVVDGWDLKNYKRNPVIMFAHNYGIPAVGTASKVWVEGKQLLNTVKWDEEDEFATFLKGKYERRVMRAESVGFRPLEFEERERKGSWGSFKFTKQELLEISLVPVPAHPRALRKAMGETGRFFMTMPEIMPLDLDVSTSVDDPMMEVLSIVRTMAETVEALSRVRTSDPVPPAPVEGELTDAEIEAIMKTLKTVRS